MVPLQISRWVLSQTFNSCLMHLKLDARLSVGRVRETGSPFLIFPFVQRFGEAELEQPAKKKRAGEGRSRVLGKETREE